ncbi:MAG: TonB-dependent receptor [Ideonella sp. MAG2]|nr:MAG: TonB-dependent receptor [Ideonella sp. MAG2]
MKHHHLSMTPTRLAVLSLIAAMLPSANALAQAATPAAAADENKLETVVVTSQRRVERLQDVPVSVKAFSSKQIESMGIGSTQDFVNLTPNMSFDNSFTYGNSFVVLRGVTQINNADSPVAVVVDGVPQNNQKQLKMDLFDIERIEVLKGPQGALYGRNAIGGAINIETKQPTNRTEGFVSGAVGNGGSLQATGAVSGALKDDVALFRVSASGKKSNGQISNTYLGQNVDAVDHDASLRAKLLLMPAQGVKVDLRASATNFKAGATWDTIVSDSQPSTIAQPRSNLLGKTTGDTTDLSAKVTADFSFATLTSITGYTKLAESYRGDIDFSNATDSPSGFLGLGFQAGQGQNLNVKMLSQELRLTSPDDQAVRWIAGVYALDTRRDLFTRVFVDTTGQLDQFDDASKAAVTLSEANRNRATAAFGQVDVDLSKNLTLASALRYDSDERKQTDVLSGAVRQAKFSNWQPKFTLTQKLDRNSLLYATYSTGFRSGGFNAPGLADFRPERLSNAEIGSKLVMLDNRLTLNAAAFYAKSKDFQFFYVDIGSGSQVISNIDKVTLKGLDVDVRYLAFKGLEFDGGIGVTDSIIEANAAQPSTVGHRTPKSVPFKVNLGMEASQALGDGLMGKIRLDYEHRDKKYWHPDNVAVSPALDLFGLRLSVAGPQDRWNVSLVGKNLTDRRYYADYNAAKYSGLPYDVGSLAVGRSWNLEAKLRF